MKVKQYLYITNPQDFLRGDYSTSLTLTGYESVYSEWINCGQIELDVNVSKEELVKSTLSALEQQEILARQEFDKKIAILSDAKHELLAIGHDDSFTKE